MGLSSCRLVCGDCIEAMSAMEEGSVDLVVTSPPYDGLRKYHGSEREKFTWDVFESLLGELWRVLADGGVIVWVVGDQTRNGSESGTSFGQALAFMERGFRLHDTMIYQKTALPKNHNRYEQEFEYMFVFSKGKPKTFNPIRIPCKYPEKPGSRDGQTYSVTDEKMRSMRSGKKRKPVGETKIKGNVWYYPTGKNHSTKDDIAFKHPAIFPEGLAADHIKSWTVEGDLVLDPLMGSGTVGKMAVLAGRDFVGIDVSHEYCHIAKSRIEHTTGVVVEYEVLGDVV